MIVSPFEQALAYSLAVKCNNFCCCPEVRSSQSTLITQGPMVWLALVEPAKSLAEQVLPIV